MINSCYYLYSFYCLLHFGLRIFWREKCHASDIFICLHFSSVQFTNFEDSYWQTCLEFSFSGLFFCLRFICCTLLCDSAVMCFCNRLCWVLLRLCCNWFFGCCLVLFVCLFAGLMKKLWTDVNNSFIRGNLAMINKVKLDISATKQLSRDTQFIIAEVGKWETERGLRWLTVRQRHTLYLLSAHLVPYGFLGWEVEGVHLRKLWSQMIVELPEFGVTSVHIPLIVQDADIHLQTHHHGCHQYQHKDKLD